MKLRVAKKIIFSTKLINGMPVAKHNPSQLQRALKRWGKTRTARRIKQAFALYLEHREEMQQCLAN